jgi:L-iditol 2-dehydrogenase
MLSERTRRVVLQAPRQLEIDEIETPKPGEGEVLVRIGQVGVCGSDMHLYRDGGIGSIRMDGPFVIGHECMGTVAAVGGGVASGLVGRRVAVEPAVHCGRCRWCREGKINVCPHGEFLGLPPRQGALQEHVSHPAELLMPLPDALSDEAGVMLEPLAIALHAIDLVEPVAGRSVAILGTGVLGSCVFELLRRRDDVQLTCVDLIASRLERVAALGPVRTILAREGATEEVVRELEEATGGEGVDVVFECAGADETLRCMCEIPAPGGTVAVIGTNPDDRIAFSSGSARRKGLRIQFVRRSLNTLERARDLALESGSAVDRLVTHRFAAPKAAESFEVVDGYRDGVLKAVVDMRTW